MASKNLIDVKERRLYVFKCGKCGRPRAYSYKRRRAREKICRKCRRSEPNPNQQALFTLT